MHRLSSATNLTMVIAILSGCSVRGRWDLAQTDRGNAEFRSLRLDKDGTFLAEGGGSPDRIEPASGTYSYENGVLILDSRDGEHHSYDADLENSGRDLKLKRFSEGKELELMYRRVSD